MMQLSDFIINIDSASNKNPELDLSGLKILGKSLINSAARLFYLAFCTLKMNKTGTLELIANLSESLTQKLRKIDEQFLMNVLKIAK